MGLGLYIAAEVIRRHEGTIAVATPLSGGTVFTVRLPRATSHADSPEGTGSMPSRATDTTHDGLRDESLVAR
jgi:hypothetical protein